MTVRGVLDLYIVAFAGASAALAVLAAAIVLHQVDRLSALYRAVCAELSDDGSVAIEVQDGQ